MALVDYSDSSEGDEHHSDDETSNTIKKRRASITAESHIDTAKRCRQEQTDAIKLPLPPLPTAFHNLYPTALRTSTHDDPSLHGGRKRAVPHVDGNWATHIYLEWYPADREMTTLSEIVSLIDDVGRASSHQSKIHSLLCNELGAQLPLHISLSRPIVLHTETRQAFSDLLERSISTCGVRPFDVRFADLDWVGNYEQTRWFLVLRLTRSSADDELSRLLYLSNQAAQAFGQPLLYADVAGKGSKQQKPSRNEVTSAGQVRKHRQPSSSITNTRRRSELPPAEEEEDVGNHHPSNHFHVSIAWTLEKPSTELLAQTRSVVVVVDDDDRRRNTTIAKVIGEMCVRFESVKLKVGNTVKDIALPTKVQESKGLIGN